MMITIEMPRTEKTLNIKGKSSLTRIVLSCKHQKIMSTHLEECFILLSFIQIKKNNTKTRIFRRKYDHTRSKQADPDVLRTIYAY